MTLLLADEAVQWYEKAGAFTLMHLAALLVFVPMIVGSSVLGYRWRGTAKERTLRKAWAWSMLAFLIATCGWYAFSGRYEPAFAYPLHVCDLMGLTACLALLIPSRWLATCTVFLGLGLCSQAFFTPVLKVGPVYLHFWYFWMGHTAIVGGASYLIVVDRYRGTLADWGLSILTLFAIIGMVLPLDIAKGWNYGFVGNVPRKPDAEPTVVDYLGEWPDRVYWLGFLAIVATGLVYLGFRVARIFISKREQLVR